MAESAKITRLRGEEPKPRKSKVIYFVWQDEAQAEADRLEQTYKRELGKTYWRGQQPDDKGKIRFEIVVPTREELQGS